MSAAFFPNSSCRGFVLKPSMLYAKDSAVATIMNESTRPLVFAPLKAEAKPGLINHFLALLAGDVVIETEDDAVGVKSAKCNFSPLVDSTVACWCRQSSLAYDRFPSFLPGVDYFLL